MFANAEFNNAMDVRVVFFFILLLLVGGCAKIVAPSGGPKDEKPPKVVDSKPANFSRNFDDDEIAIEFNEFVRLNDISNKLLISPPLEQKPKVVNKGKEIELKIESPLRDNTTYSFNFNDAIADNNEGNVLEGFEFVFSTGSSIDSLSLTGRVVNAFDSKPQQNVYAMLYDSLIDSIPYIKSPYYLAKTDAEGSFRINNIRHDTFKIFILDDKNANYKYDLPNERIAFADTLVSFHLDSAIEKDTAGEGPSLEKVVKEYRAPSLTYFLFTEDPVNQYIKTSTRVKRNLLSISFNEPLAEPLKVDPIFIDHQSDWAVMEPNLQNDSISYWIKDSALIKSDTFRITLDYTYINNQDSLQAKRDTVMMRSYASKADKQKANEALSLNPSVSKGSFLPLGDSLWLHAGVPVDSVDTSQVRLYVKKDTLFDPLSFAMEKRKNALKTYLLNHDWQAEKEYRLDVFPRAFVDVYGNTNDTVKISFKTREEGYYGNLILNMDSILQPAVVQLFKAGGELVRQARVRQDEQLRFNYLVPGNYRLKAIMDNNDNGRWDTGNYLKGIQPEQIKNYQGEVEIRANWDLEQSWNLATTAVVKPVAQEDSVRTRAPF